MKSKVFGLLVSVGVALAACAGQDNREPIPVSGFDSHAGVGPQAQREPAGERSVSDMHTDQVLVKFSEGTDIGAIKRIAQEAGLERLKVVSPPNLYLMRAENGTALEEAIERLKAYPEVLYVERNYPRVLKGNGTHD